MIGTNVIVCIAGGIWQKPFVQYLKDRGYYIVIVNPVVTKTTELADYHIKCDVNNFDEINKHIAKFKPIFITSDQSDISTAIVARLSEYWNLPGNSVLSIDKFTNKYSMFEFGNSLGLPVPKTALVNSITDVFNFIDLYGFPIILKPVDSTMSRGFVKISTRDELTEDVLQNSMSFSKIKSVIVQSFVSGNMVTLEGVCSGGKHKTIASSIKLDYFCPGITCGVSYPDNLDKDLLHRIELANDTYVEASGMQFGLTHSEYLVEGDNFCLIEIGARGGGAGISNMITPYVSGIDNYKIFHDSLVGNIIDVKSLKPLRRSALLRYYRQEDVSEEQAKKIIKIPGVATFCYNFKETQYVKNSYDCRFSMGIYLAQNSQQMNELMDQVDYHIN